MCFFNLDVNVSASALSLPQVLPRYVDLTWFMCICPHTHTHTHTHTYIYIYIYIYIYFSVIYVVLLDVMLSIVSTIYLRIMLSYVNTSRCKNSVDEDGLTTLSILRIDFTPSNYYRYQGIYEYRKILTIFSSTIIRYKGKQMKLQ